jgi:glutamate carboxypeptidase
MTSVVDLVDIRTRLEERVEAYMADLRELVGIDSGTDDKPGNDRVGAWLRDRYRALGATIDIRPHATFGDAFVVRWTGGGRGRVLLLGHTDTVYAQGTAEARPLRIEGDRAYGPGAADMKGGDLLILYALETLFGLGWNDFATIEIVHNTDEEVGSPSSREIVRERSREADVVLVLEAGRENGDIVSARKGIMIADVVVTGQAAHAGVNHDRGRSAALCLAHLVVDLEGINGTIPGVTLNVGTISAGGRTNVVPDRGEARLEVRAPDHESLDAAVTRVREILARAPVEGTDVMATISVEHSPMHPSPDARKLIDLTKSMARDLGLALSDQATGGASDGNTAAEAGKPVVDGLGPVGGSAHSPGEYVLIPSIAPRGALLAGLIQSVGRADWNA